MTGGPLWAEMHEQRRSPADLTRREVPESAGVYAWYRAGAAIYVGKATSLQSRVWGNHLGRGRVMTSSSFRRDVANHLGIASANAIKKREYQPSDAEVQAVRAFIEGCSVAWLTVPDEPAAVDLERRMKREWMPPLTRI